jgi:hypothetical protein
MTLELNATKTAALRLLKRPDVAKILRAPGRGLALQELASSAMFSASAVGLLRVPEETPESFVDAGRAMQRIWLDAVRLGIGLQPWTALLYVARSLDNPGQDLLNKHETAEVRALSERLYRVFSDRHDWSSAMLFRLVCVHSPTMRSLRRPLVDTFHGTGASLP